MEEKRLIKMIIHIKNNVVIGGSVEIRTGKLSIDKNNLLRNSEGRKGSISNLPFEEKVRILGPSHHHNHGH